jgi:hypothetical protein
MPNPFTPRFENLPTELPIFPLGGAIVLPGRQLPLNIFEPRYLSMALDALGSTRMIGMIQPENAEQDAGVVAVRRIGCAGRITSFAETDDGRLLVVLTGVCRFAVASELAPRHGYRCVAPDWTAFAADLAPGEGCAVDRSRLRRLIEQLLERRGMQLDWEQAEALPDDVYVDAFAMNLPLAVAEKQALLEAPGIDQRAELLVGFAAMELRGAGAGSTASH